MPNFKLLDVNETAERLGRHPSWVRELIYSGQLKTVGGSRRLVVSEGELERFVSNTVAYVPRRGPNKGKKGAAK
jgi:Helix-turn-helix domain